MQCYAFRKQVLSYTWEKGFLPLLFISHSLSETLLVAETLVLSFFTPLVTFALLISVHNASVLRFLKYAPCGDKYLSIHPSHVFIDLHLCGRKQVHVSFRLTHLNFSV